MRNTASVIGLAILILTISTLTKEYQEEMVAKVSAEEKSSPKVRPAESRLQQIEVLKRRWVYINGPSATLVNWELAVRGEPRVPGNICVAMYRYKQIEKFVETVTPKPTDISSLTSYDLGIPVETVNLVFKQRSRDYGFALKAIPHGLPPNKECGGLENGVDVDHALIAVLRKADLQPQDVRLTPQILRNRLLFGYRQLVQRWRETSRTDKGLQHTVHLGLESYGLTGANWG